MNIRAFGTLWSPLDDQMKSRIGKKGVWLTHVNHGRANPCTDALLSTVEDSMHHPRRLRSGLYTVQALTGVTQPVW